MQFLICIITFIFVPLAVGETTHPQYINCKLPNAENHTVIYNNATWQRCTNNKLEIKYCIAEIVDSEYICIWHWRIKKTMDEATGLKAWFAPLYYVTGSERKYVDCGKLKREQPATLVESLYKKRCLDDLGETAVKTSSDQNSLCLMQQHKLIYIDGFNGFTCQEGKLQLDRCMLKETIEVDEENVDQFKCVSKERFSDDQWRTEKFCDQFSNDPATYLPDYKKHWTDCNSDFGKQTAPPSTTPKTTTTTEIPPPAPIAKIHEKATPVESSTRISQSNNNVHSSVAGQTTFSTPQYIGCKKLSNDFIVVNDSEWFECHNGKLQLQKCISEVATNDSYYRCVDQHDLEVFFDDLAEADDTFSLQDVYINGNIDNPLNCERALKEAQINGFGFDNEQDCNSDRFIAFSRGTTWKHPTCLTQCAGGYHIHNFRLYQCNQDAILDFTKCVVKTSSGQHQCVIKSEAQNILDQQSLSYDIYSSCNVFYQNYESLKSKTTIPLVDCDVPFVPAATPKSAFAPVVNPQEVVIQGPATETNPITVVDITEAAQIEDPKMCNLSSIDLPGKCINIDEFIAKFDNVSFESLFTKQLDMDKTLQEINSVVDVIGELTIKDLSSVMSEDAKPTADSSPTKLLFNLGKKLKKKSDCNLLHEHALVHRQALCNIIKDCTPSSKPSPKPDFCN